MRHHHDRLPVVGALRTLVRRADAGLATTAARNAAICMHSQQHQRRLEDARTLRDLAAIPQARTGAADDAVAAQG